MDIRAARSFRPSHVATKLKHELKTSKSLPVLGPNGLPLKPPFAGGGRKRVATFPPNTRVHVYSMGTWSPARILDFDEEENTYAVELTLTSV